MIIYLAARIFSALYGYEWPLPGEVKGLLATFSVWEFILVSALAVGACIQHITERKGKH